MLSKNDIANKSIEQGFFNPLLGTPVRAMRDFPFNEIMSKQTLADPILVRKGSVGVVVSVGHKRLAIARDGEIYLYVKFPETKYPWYFPMDSLTDPKQGLDSQQ